MIVRRARSEDLEAATDLVVRANLADLGAANTSLEEVRGDWARPGAEAWLAEEDDRLAGYVWLWQRWPDVLYVDAVLDPGVRGRGLEEELVRVGEERARERSLARVQAFAVTPETASALERSGYALVRHHFQMEIELGVPPAAPVWPDGASVRTFVPGRDDGPVKELMDLTFREEYGHQEEPLDDWRSRLVENDFFDPALWLLAEENDALVGACLAYVYPDGGWIQGVGVRPDRRRRGLGLALLREVFRAFHERGVREAALSVDVENPTGATRLYERAGMSVAFRLDRYEKTLG